LPNSAKDIKYYQESIFDVDFALIKFDIPLTDLKLILEKSKTLPNYSELKENALLRKRMEEDKHPNVEWWKPDKLENAKYAEWSEVEKLQQTPNTIVNVFKQTSVSCSEIRRGLMRVYISAYGESTAIPTLKPAGHVEGDEIEETDNYIWGEEVDGLRAAVQFVPEKECYSFGEKIDVRFKVKNVSNKAIILPTTTWRFGTDSKCIIKDKNEKMALVGHAWYTGRVEHEMHRIMPAETVTLRALSLAIAKNKSQKKGFEHPIAYSAVLVPGEYSLYYELEFPDVINDIKSNIAFPLSDTWQGKLITDIVKLCIEAGESEREKKETIQSNTPKDDISELVSPGQDEEAVKKETANLFWGEEVNGLRVAVQFVPEKASYSLGERVNVRYHVQNVSDHDIQIASRASRQDLPFIKDEEGNNVSVHGYRQLGFSGEVRHILVPSKTAVLNGYALGFEDADDPALIGPPVMPLACEVVRCEPGKHFIHYEVRLPDLKVISYDDGKDNVPEPNDWQGTLRTGVREVVITSRPEADLQRFKVVLHRESIHSAVLKLVRKYRARVCFEKFDVNLNPGVIRYNNKITGTFSGPTISKLLDILCQNTDGRYRWTKHSKTYVVHPEQSQLMFTVALNISKTPLKEVVRRIMDQGPDSQEIAIKQVTEYPISKTHSEGIVKGVNISKHYAMYALCRAVENTGKGEYVWSFDNYYQRLTLHHLPERDKKLEKKIALLKKEFTARIMDAFKQEPPKQDYTDHMVKSHIFRLRPEDLVGEDKEQRITGIIRHLQDLFDPNLGPKLNVVSVSDEMVIVDIYRENKASVPIQKEENNNASLDTDGTLAVELDAIWRSSNNN